MAIRNNTTNLSNDSFSLFEPLVVRDVREGGGSGINIYETQDGSITNDSSLGISSSFKYDVQGTGIKNTQQLKVDWSNFANHTFFNNAQVKTNVAFQKILNEYPFDGNQQKVELFLDGLTGFERHVYEQFPKHKDYLFFSGTMLGETYGGTYVLVKDASGVAFPDASVKTTGQSVLDPGTKSMTIEFHVFLPEQANDNQTILDKHSETGLSNVNGFFIGLDSTVSTTDASLTFIVASGSVHDTLSIPVTKGKWNHVAWVWDRNSFTNSIFGYVNQVLISSSSNLVEFDNVLTSAPELLIGSGSNVGNGVLFAPETTFSGALDELRIWHGVRTSAQRTNYEKKALFADDNNLKAYYRFNEPSDTNSNIVIDYSSNSLHGRLSSDGVFLNVRSVDKNSIASNPMTFEKLEYCPILFPDSTGVFTLQNNFLVKAEAYDKINPNLITRLIPPHYLLEGQENDGLETEEGEIVNYTDGGTDPRSAKIGGTQTLLLMLYTWAKFFDEIKLYTQVFSNLDFVDYNETDTVPDEFLQDMASRYGLTLPPLFQGSSIDQFVNGENVDNVVSTNSMTLRAVQNQIWRRILINMQDFMKSKGTIHSVKSFIRTVGIDPDSTFRIREFGGPTKKTLSFTRDNKTETSTMLNFVSGGYVRTPSLISTQPKTETGWPESSNLADSDLLLTSGSFSFEGTYRFPPNLAFATSQSLVRLHTETTIPGVEDTLLSNIVAVKGGNIDLYVRSIFFGPPVADTLILSITGADIFDGSPWYVSFGRHRGDDPGLNLSSTSYSSSFFLRVAKAENGQVVESKEVSSFYLDSNPNLSFNPLQIYEESSGYFMPYIAVGSGSIVALTDTDNYALGLSHTGSLVPEDSRYTDFEGKVTQLRFWSKYLQDNEWKEHVRNYRSVGVVDPKVNFNFDTINTGSWERLRIDCSTDQIVTQSNGLGEITLTDFTQNSLHMTGSGFVVNSQVIVPQRFYFSYISPKFDEASSVDKIRVRGYQDYSKIKSTPWAEQAPVYNIPKSETPTDNERFSIDFSVVDALNQDIMTIFATLDEMDNAIGNPELMFSEDYPDLENLRKIYFNKLTSQLNIKGFFEFFKWFDTNIGTFVSQLLPRKTKFLGTNYIIEQHALERSKVKYQFEDMYLGDSNRNALKDNILLQLIQGDFSRL